MDPAEKSGPRKLNNIQGLPPLNSRAVHPNKTGARQKCQKTCVDEHRAPGKTQTLKEHMQKCTILSSPASERYGATGERPVKSQ